MTERQTTPPPPLVLTTAAGRFESARHVSLLPAGHRSRALHGHSFQAMVTAALPPDWAPYPGGEVPALRQRMEQVLAPLNYTHLNQVIEQPTDENLARWIREQLALPGIDRVAVQSTADQGVDLDRDGMAHVWRRYRFQAAHRLPHVPPGHKCGRMHGHGFEAIVHANQDLGSRALSIDYDHLDAIWAPLHGALNYQCLNEVAGLENPTSEIIAAWLWQRLQPALPELSWVTVFETGSCGANFDGHHYRIWKDFTLDSAAQVKRAPPGTPQGGVHGHTYTLRLHLKAPLDAVMGWTIDFGDVKTLFDPLFQALDHRPLHEIADLADADTASVAAWIYRAAQALLPPLVRVDLFETEGCGAIVTQAIEGPALPA
jgi:6-pyruvoyltetrahydropterin/6-carboxytetrahydropterin synthase